MKTLIVFRERISAYNQITTLKDEKGKVKKVYRKMLNQPHRKNKTIKLNNVMYQLNWQNVK
jgi:hypothetical protein